MKNTEDNLRELFAFFDHSRVSKSDVAAAGRRIKDILEKSGYLVEVSQGFNANIETACPAPRFILTAHYDSPFLFIKDPCIEWERKINFILSKDSIAASFLLAGVLLIHILNKVFEIPFIILALLYFFILFEGPYGFSTQVVSADDNTSGIVAALLLAQELKNYQDQVQFVFFDKEEWGLLGSKNYVKKNAANWAANLGILNFDCVGRGEGIILSSQEKKNSLNAFRDAFSHYLRGKNIDFMMMNQSKCDCKSFRKKGFEAFSLQRKDIIRGKPRLGWIHTFGDTPEAIDFKKIEEVVYLVSQFIRTY